MKEIKDYENYFVTTDGKIFNMKRNKYLSPCKDKLGYVGVLLSKSGFLKRHYVHRLVANAFIDNPMNYNEVNHINGDKSDNRIENLEWCSRSQNIKHAYATGLKKNKYKEGKPYKCVIDTQTGEIYNSPKEAALVNNINIQTLYGYLSGHFKNQTSLIYL
jgi:hypothetical protein